jgi:L-ectoine synthase
MKIIRLEGALTVNCPFGGFISRRMLVESDGMGFTITNTVIPVSGKAEHWHYTQHLEACYCVSGRGILRDLATDMEHLIIPGTVYALDKHDDHTFEALEEVTLICVFNPPLKGMEIHQEDGSYAK